MWAHWEEKSYVEQKGESSLDFDFQYEYKVWEHGLSILQSLRRSIFKVEVSEKLPQGRDSDAFGYVWVRYPTRPPC